MAARKKKVARKKAPSAVSDFMLMRSAGIDTEKNRGRMLTPAQRKQLKAAKKLDPKSVVREGEKRKKKSPRKKR